MDRNRKGAIMLYAVFNPETNEYFTGKFFRLSKVTGSNRAWSVYLNKAKLYFKLEEARRARASLNKKHPEWGLKIQVFELNMIKEV